LQAVARPTSEVANHVPNTVLEHGEPNPDAKLKLATYVRMLFVAGQEAFYLDFLRVWKGFSSASLKESQASA